ncbi:MAG TPA: hypothetical protein VFN51_02725 [Candidatus Saccharimonadales bacterium]|nr:hypothetical protein [Candidatus Saccharimonadales bacterium]
MEPKPDTQTSPVQAPEAANPAAEPLPVESKKPSLNLSDAEAQALLLVNGVQAAQVRHKKLPLGILITVASLIILAVMAALVVSSLKPGGGVKSGSSSIGLPNQASPSTGGDVTNNINQDVQTCSNPVNASLVC